jgi:hypothetical protein
VFLHKGRKERGREERGERREEKGERREERGAPGRLPHGVYHFWMLYIMRPLVYTMWYIPCGIYHDTYHGIYHSKVIYSVIYTMVYTIWYISCNIP